MCKWLSTYQTLLQSQGWLWSLHSGSVLRTCAIWLGPTYNLCPPKVRCANREEGGRLEGVKGWNREGGLTFLPPLSFTHFLSPFFLACPLPPPPPLPLFSLLGGLSHRLNGENRKQTSLHSENDVLIVEVTLFLSCMASLWHVKGEIMQLYNMNREIISRTLLLEM